VEQALKEFCEQKGLKSKKGAVLSAGINTVLAEFFGISNTEEGSTPIKFSNIPSRSGSTLIEPGNIPTTSTGSTPVQTTSNIPVESFVVGELPGKLQA
jgi:hypothetical protein